MSPIETYTEGANFWENNEQYKVAEPFKSLYTSDKSRGKKESSTKMWFIAFCYDLESRYEKLQEDGEDGKHYVIGSDFCSNPNFYEDHKDVLDPCIEMYVKMNYSPMRRHLKTWNDLLNNRTSFLKTQKYSLETFEDLDKMAVGTQKVHATIKAILDDISKEDTAGTVEGGSMESLND